MNGVIQITRMIFLKKSKEEGTLKVKAKKARGKLITEERAKVRESNAQVVDEELVKGAKGSAAGIT